MWEHDAPYMYTCYYNFATDIDKVQRVHSHDTSNRSWQSLDTPVAYVMVVMQMVPLKQVLRKYSHCESGKDFARLKGFKEIQLYIPAKLKANSDLKAYKDQLYQTKQLSTSRDANG